MVFSWKDNIVMQKHFLVSSVTGIKELPLFYPAAASTFMNRISSPLLSDILQVVRAISNKSY